MAKAIGPAFCRPRSVRKIRDGDQTGLTPRNVMNVPFVRSAFEANDSDDKASGVLSAPQNAASEHEAAAHHHREACHHHEQGQHEEAKVHAGSAQSHCQEADKLTKTACGCSQK